MCCVLHSASCAMVERRKVCHARIGKTMENLIIYNIIRGLEKERGNTADRTLLDTDTDTENDNDNDNDTDND